MAEAGYGDSQQHERQWKPLRFFNLYRIALASTFAILYQADHLPSPLGENHPGLFHGAALAYVAVALISLYLTKRQRPDFDSQLHWVMISDIVLLTLLMHASGGGGSSLGLLLVVSIANGSMIAAGRSAGLFAALASIAVLIERFYSLLQYPGTQLNLATAGFLGIALFTMAILAHVLARRLQESEALARQRGIDLANMAELTEHIIQRMQTGIVVIDPNYRVRLTNSAARALLDIDGDNRATTLKDLSQPLLKAVLAWRTNEKQGGSQTLLEGPRRKLLLHFMNLGGPHYGGVLIFIEDASRTTQQAQQLKLASLGRLTASIAHEIRNPLAAISHAGELLHESPALPTGDRRLTEIIHNQTRRVNTIIEDVLQLGRRDSSQPQTFTLNPWLEEFLAEFLQQEGVEQRAVQITAMPRELSVQFDPNHLRQILTNLGHNALRHAVEAGPGGACVELSGGHDRFGRAYLDVLDYGPGIAAGNLPHIFEPFFTTEQGGTGLGLYISRELAECNHARLEYLPASDGPCRFRLSFANPMPQSDFRASLKIQ